MPLNPARTISELKEHRTLTGNADGAQRVAFTRTWATARKFLREKLAAIPNLEIHQDPAGNLWATFKGKSERGAKKLLAAGKIEKIQPKRTGAALA